jgi:ATP-dependent protease ClpP protease subunit
VTANSRKRMYVEISDHLNSKSVDYLINAIRNSSKSKSLGLRITSSSGNPREILRFFDFLREFFGPDGEGLEVVVGSGSYEDISYMLLLPLSAGGRRFIHENTLITFGSPYDPEEDTKAEDDIINELSFDERNALNENILRKLVERSSLMSASNVVAAGLADGIYPRIKKDPN